jgi:hypothetical protein
MSEPIDLISRADVLRRIAGGSAAALAVAMTARAAEAAPGLTQAAAKYQTTPKNGQHCAGCQLYIPAKTNPTTAKGACQAVQGSISPNGWCQLYAPKAASH